MESLVSTEWLGGELGAGDLRIVDASRHLPDAKRDAAAEYLAGHIPGAVFMNLGELTDPHASVENTLPSAARFAARMEALGIGDGSRIVLYDDSAVKTSARAWFMLRMYGAQQVAILDGGLPKWKAEGRPLVAGERKLRRRHFTIWRDERDLRTKSDLLGNLTTKDEQVVDARSAARFTGAEPDPRPQIAAGHIPQSLNLPYGRMFNADGTFRSKAELREAFVSAGVDLSQPIVTSCGSGITACVLLFALHLIGIERAGLYDGSWTEWGGDPATPKSIGIPA